MRSYRPFLWITICFALGILFQEWGAFSFGCLLLAVCICVGTYVLVSRHGWLSSLCLLAVFIPLGSIFSLSYQTLPANHIYSVSRYYRQTPVWIEGVVVSDVQKRDFFKGKKTSFVLTVKRLKTKWGWKKKTGKLQINIFRDAEVQYGDYLRVEGKMHQPFEFSSGGAFSYKDYLNRKGIKFILSMKKQSVVEVIKTGQGNFCKALSLRIKRKLNAVLTQNLTPNEAGIMQAVLLGERHHIPQHIRQLYERAGVAHVFAISGLHIGIMAFLIFMFLKMLPIPRAGQYLLTIIFLICYAFMTGARPSVVRATIMASVFLSSFILERETDSVNTLAFAAFLILLINPLNVFDIGFQLSFLSVLAIIYFYPYSIKVFNHFLENHKSSGARWFAQSLCVSATAYLGVLGLVMYYFQIITPIGIVTNLMIIPLMAVIVALGVGLLCVGIVLPQGAVIFAVCLKVLLNIMAGIIFLIIKIPGAYFDLHQIPLWSVGIYYILVCIGGCFIRGAKLTKGSNYATLSKL